jgi:hypothetical protein
VGSQGFVAKTKQELGIRARVRSMARDGSAYHLGEPEISYMANFSAKNEDIGAENGYLWNSILDISIS